MQRILFIAPKSPPTSGLANISLAVSQLLDRHGSKVFFLCATPRFASRLYPGLAWRFTRLLFFSIWVFPRYLAKLIVSDTVYLNVSGGIALWFDCLFARTARLAGKRIFVHHNSFSYINEKSKLAAMAFRAAGPEALHIVNCRCMQDTLESTYELVNQTQIVSNASIVAAVGLSQAVDKSVSSSEPGARESTERTRPKLTVGYMSYYTQEKGIGLFCETVARARVAGADIAAVAAGIVHDSEYFLKLSHSYQGHVDFCGPRYGTAKDRFFDDVDVLLFPSMYKTEAEPLVVHEALQKGVPVIATDIGCLPEVLSGLPHCHIIPAKHYADRVSSLLIDMSVLNLAQLNTRRAELRGGYQDVVQVGEIQLNRYLASIGT